MAASWCTRGFWAVAGVDLEGSGSPLRVGSLKTLVATPIRRSYGVELPRQFIAEAVRRTPDVHGSSAQPAA
jgi:hypothetical protein